MKLHAVPETYTEPTLGSFLSAFRSKVATVITTLLLARLAASGAAACAATDKAPVPAAAAAVEPDHLTTAALGHVVRHTAAPSPVATLPCPSDTVILKNYSDLSEVAATANKTYLLGDGTYFITSTIVLDTPGTVTCYQAAYPGLPEDVGVLEVMVNVKDDSTGNRAWVATNGARLGLQHMILSGSDTSAGILAEAEQASNAGGMMLEVKDVKFEFFVCQPSTWDMGAAVLLNNVDATFWQTTFFDNTCEHKGGALAITNSKVVFTSVRRMN